MTDTIGSRDERYDRATMHYQGMGGDPGKQCSSVEEMRGDAIETVKHWMEMKGEIPPTFWVYMPMESPCVAVLFIEECHGSEEKHLAGRNVSLFAARHNAAAVVMATDGWAVEAPRELTKPAMDGVPGAEAKLRQWTDAQYAKYKTMANHPDRIEVLTVNTIYPDGTCLGWASRYERVKVTCDKCAGKGCGDCKQRGAYDSIKWGETHDDWPEAASTDANHRTQQFLIPPWGMKGV